MFKNDVIDLNKISLFFHVSTYFYVIPEKGLFWIQENKLYFTW
jgi:hypothetical protein